MGTERDFAWGAGCTVPCADDVLLSGMLETCMVLQINATPINSIKKSIQIFSLLSSRGFTIMHYFCLDLYSILS